MPAKTLSGKRASATAAAPPAETEIVAFKVFNSDFQCRNFQFEVGGTYTAEGVVRACSNGFHAMENPMDVWKRYPLVQDDGKLSRYGIVGLAGEIDREASNNDSKIAAATITVKVELSLPGYSSKQAASGYSSTQAASGYSSTFEITGKDGVIACAGRKGTVSAATVVGTWVSLAEYDGRGKCIGFATGCIGQDGLEAGKAYRAKGGKLVEVTP